MSSEDEETTIDVKGLDALIKAMKVAPPEAKVGILGSKSSRSSSVNNAEVGAFQEFGTTTIPIRSFLRVPISEHLENKMESSGALDEDVFKEAMESRTLVPYMEKIAVLAEGIVLEAFDTGGFGDWPPSDMTHKKVKQTLVETGQLRNSITHEVK